MNNNVIRIDSIFKRWDKKLFTIPSGKTIDEIISLPEVTKDFPINSDISVAINGNIIPMEQWVHREVKEGEYLFFVPKVAGGDDGKTVLNIVMMIALIYVGGPMGTSLAGGEAAVAAGGTAAFMAGVYTTAIVVGGGMIISALQPHPKKPSSGFIDSEDSQSFGWNPQTLQRQGISIPRMYGKNKVLGNVVGVHTEKEAITFEETTIAEMYYYWNETHRFRLQGYRNVKTMVEFDPRKINLYAQICESVGPIREPVMQDTMKLNDQPIKNLTGVYWEERNGLLRQNAIGFFENTILEVFVGRIVKNGSPIIYTTSNGNFHNLEIEVSFPQGLYDGSGADLANNTVNITVEIKKNTASVWVKLADNVAITEAVGNKVIRTYVTDGIFTVDFGSNYDIRVTKETAERDSLRYGDDLFLDKVREITEIQFQHPRRALVGVKVLATEQLSGSIRWSAYARGLYVVNYNDSANKIEYSNNPALVIADILTQPVYSGSYSPWLDMNLFLNFEGADAATSTIDDSIRGHSITFGGSAQIDTAQFRFGSSSGLLDGIDDYFQIVNNRNLFGLFDSLMEDWTFDLYLRMGDHVGVEMIASQWIDANNNWYLEHLHGTGLSLVVRVNTSIIINIAGVGEITDNDWHHLAICKSKKEVGLYKDDVQVGYALMSANAGYVFENSDLYLGQRGNSTFYLYGHYDHVRFFKRNYFEVVPVSGLTDTITKPSVLFTDPGNSFEIERYDGYNPSKLLVADVEELYDWCSTAQVNSKNFTISGISLATNAVVTTTSKHNREIGDIVLFRSVDNHGMVELLDGTTAEVIGITDDFIFTVDLDTSGYTVFDAQGWLGVNSSHLVSHCGDSLGDTLADALNGIGIWRHIVSEQHQFIIDLGQIQNIQKVRGRSDMAEDPTDINIYVSETNGNWGAAVASGISTWQDTISWVEIDTTDKDGRFMKIEIDATEDGINGRLIWGDFPSYIPILDVYTLRSTATVEEYQPRFSFNGIFDTEKTMWEAVLSVCELCRCIPFWSGDKIRFAIDRSKISSYAFTMGNILTNSYKEVYIPQKDRASEIEVHFRDDEKDFARSPYTLMNPNSGRIVNKVRMDMFGIIQSDMSQRLANHKLKQLQHIKKMGFWSTDVEGIPCEIGDKVDVQNDASNYGQIGSGDDKYTGGGRIVVASELSNGNTLITIDGEIAFSDADWDGGSTEYKMLVKGKTDTPPESRQITGIAASVVDNGTYDITILGMYAVTPVVDDVWAAGISEYETIPYILTDLKQSSTQRVDCVGIHYVEDIYDED